MFEMLKNFYNNKKILITGHTGFKGSWLALWLHLLGAKVGGLSLDPPTEPSLFKTLDLESRIEYHQKGDIRDPKSFDQAFEKFSPQVVFHLAAQSLVGISYQDPKTTYETNVLGTLNLFETVRKRKGSLLLINVTSDKCYENREQIYSYRETDSLGGYDPYSSSKGMSEILTSSYRNSFFHPDQYGKNHQVLIATGRAGNVIGGGDFAADRLIPDLVRSLSSGQVLKIRSPKAIRPWQFVLEPLSGYLLLPCLMDAQGPFFAQAWNFGPFEQDVLTVEEVIRKSIGIFGKGGYEILPNPSYHEARMLKLDISKAQHYLRWHPQYHVEKALEETLRWYKNFYEGHGNMFDYSKEQIQSYMENKNAK